MKKIIICLLFIFSQSCQKNLLEGFGSQDVDDFHYNDALEALNEQRYADSIAIITQQMSAAGQAQVKSRELLASAYAGRCGLNFVDYTSRLAEQSSGSPLRLTMYPFVGRIADPSFCRLSLDTIELLGPTELRTTNQNTFAAVVGMVLLGASLRTSADLVPVFGNGIADVDLCSAVSDEAIDNMLIGFGYFNRNLAYVGDGLIGSYANSNLAQVGDTCTAQFGAATCEVIDPAEITPTMRLAFRDLANTLEHGIGTYSTGGDPAMIPNACP